MWDKNNQEVLKKMDKFDNITSNVMFRIFVIFYVLLTVFVLAATIYYGVYEIQGKGHTEQFAIYFTFLLVLAAIPACSKLIDLFIKQFFKKDDAYDPHKAELPAPGTVTLEDALHRMSTQTGVIVWDVLWGCVLFSLFCLLALDMGDWLRIMLICVCVAAIMAVGHLFFRLLWKKRSFIKRMLRNTAKCMPIACPSDYVKGVEESLKRNVLSYEKEFIMTDEYILGCAEQDTSFIPVALPREQIDEFVFFYRRTVNGRYSRTVGILSCRAGKKKLADLVLGQGPKVNKVLRILKYYDISWRKEETTYI